MPIKVECDVCGAKYRVGDERAGKILPCKSCGADMDVPRPRDAEDEFFEDERPLKQRRGTQRRGPNSTVVAGLAGGALVLVGLVIGLMLLMRAGDDEAPQVAQNGPAANAPAVPPSPVFNFNAGGNANPANVAPPPAASNRPATNSNVSHNSTTRPGGFQTAKVPPPKTETASEPKPPSGFQPATIGTIRGGSGADGRPTFRPSGWTVQVDPPAQPLAWEEGKTLNIPLPRDLNFTEVAQVVQFLGGPYVSLGNNSFENHARELWDVVNRRKLGTITGIKAVSGTPAIGSDGRYFAIATDGNGADRGIFAWDLQEKKPLGKLPLKDDPAFAAIAGTDRLVAGGGSWMQTIQTWKLPSGDPEHTIELPERHAAKSLCVSPGGRYLALCSQRWEKVDLHVYDLTTGQPAGESRATVAKHGGNDCEGMAFSPDGAELAAKFGKEIVIWDVADGRIVDQFSFEEDSTESFFASTGPAVQWVPGRRRLLIGSYLILDRQAQAVVWKFAVEQGSMKTPRRAVGESQLLELENPRDKPALVSITLPQDMIAKAAEAAAAGGVVADAGLPKLTAPQRDDVRTVDLKTASGGWRVGADPAPKAAAPLAAQPIDVSPNGGGHLFGLQLSSAAAGKAAVFYTAQPVDTGTIPEGLSREQRRAMIRSRISHNLGGKPGVGTGLAWVKLVDLAGGPSQKAITLDFTTLLVALSPSASRAAFQLLPSEDRLDVFATADGSHVVGWRPYQSEKHEHERKISAAVFVDDEHLLTLSSGKKLTLWQIPACRAVYEIENAERPALSPGGRYLVLSDGKSLKFFDARSGDAQGALTLDGQIGAVAFHPDGNRLAVTALHNNNTKLFCWSLQDGKVLHEFPIAAAPPTALNPFDPGQGDTMHWCGAEHLLLNGEQLISLPHKMVVWKYEIGKGVQSPTTPDGRHWFLAGKSGGTSSIYLAAVDLPDPRAAEKLTAADPKPETRLQPGGTFSVSFNLQQPPGKPNFQQDAFKAILGKLGQSNIKPQAGAPVTLVCKMAQGSTGKSLAVRKIGRGESTEYTEQHIDSTAQWTHGGKVLWEQTSRSSNQIIFDRIEEGKSIEQHATERMWERAADFFLHLTPPAWVFTEGAAAGLGTSQLSPDGAAALSSRP